MKTKIDFDKLKRKAAANDVSIFLLVKREYKYTKSEEGRKCDNCKFKRFPVFAGCERMQCEIIGIGDDFYADINEEFVCTEYQNRYARKKG